MNRSSRFLLAGLVVAGLAGGTSFSAADETGQATEAPPKPIAEQLIGSWGVDAPSTLAAVFTIGVTLSLIGRTVAGHITRTDLIVSAVLIPAVFAGYLVARRYQDRVSQQTVRTIILVVSGVAGVGLILRALLAV